MNTMGIRIRDNVLSMSENIWDSNLHTGLQRLAGDGGGLSITAKQTYKHGYTRLIFDNNSNKRFHVTKNDNTRNCDDQYNADPGTWKIYVRCYA